MCLQTKINDVRNLVISWRDQERRRYAVAELHYTLQGAVRFSYLRNSVDWQKALEAGFRNFPGINERNLENDKDILLLLASRLPPKRRDDYNAFLEQILISPALKDELTTFQLLAYSFGRSVNDSFEFIDPLTDATGYSAPILIEIAGTSHAVRKGNFSREDIRVNDSVTLIEDNSNPIDSNAVKVVWNGREIGFVNKVQALGVRNLLEQGTTAKVAKVNGTVARPRIVLELDRL